MKIPFLSFDFQNKITRDSVIESITGVIDSKRYVLSKNVLSNITVFLRLLHC